MVESFHIRTNIPQHQKIAGEKKARSLEKIMLEMFRGEPDKIFTEYDFDNGELLFTSVRRSLSNLKKAKFITACSPSEKVMGKRGVSITTYKLANPQPNNQEVFPWMKN